MLINHYTDHNQPAHTRQTNPRTKRDQPRRAGPQPGAPDESGNQGALPQNPDSMPPPHAHKHAGAPTTTQQAAAGVFPTPITRQTNHPAHQCTTVGRPAFRKGKAPQPAQTHSTIQTTHDQEATPHNQSLERR